MIDLGFAIGVSNSGDDALAEKDQELYRNSRLKEGKQCPYILVE